MTKRLVVGITGASGALYAQRFLQMVEPLFETVYLIVSEAGRKVLATELGVGIDRYDDIPRELLGRTTERIRCLENDDMFTPPASGSTRHDGMVIVPCSMGTAGRVAGGISDSLLTRSADVCLKERRPLVLVVREAPLSVVHLRNLVNLAEAGAHIVPASPPMYHRPESVEQMVDGLLVRVAQLLGRNVDGALEWQI